MPTLDVSLVLDNLSVEGAILPCAVDGEIAPLDVTAVITTLTVLADEPPVV